MEKHEVSLYKASYIHHIILLTQIFEVGHVPPPKKKKIKNKNYIN